MGIVDCNIGRQSNSPLPDHIHCLQEAVTYRQCRGCRRISRLRPACRAVRMMDLGRSRPFVHSVSSRSESTREGRAPILASHAICVDCSRRWIRGSATEVGAQVHPIFCTRYPVETTSTICAQPAHARLGVGFRPTAASPACKRAWHSSCIPDAWIRPTCFRVVDFVEAPHALTSPFPIRAPRSCRSHLYIVPDLGGCWPCGRCDPTGL